MSDNILIDCHKCGQKIRIPADAGAIHVTCPKCREQWDWPRPRIPLAGAKAFFAGFFGRSKEVRRVAFSYPRFTWAQLIVAWLGGIGIGVLAAAFLHIGGKPAAAPQSEIPPVPTVPALTNTAAPVATNILNPPGINPKIEGAIPASVQDLQPAKKNQ